MPLHYEHQYKSIKRSFFIFNIKLAHTAKYPPCMGNNLFTLDILFLVSCPNHLFTR